MNLEKAEAIAKEKMLEHGLDGWEFSFDDSVRRRGACHWSRKMITLSRKLTELRSDDSVVNTILHEIAHALAGAKEMHGSEWKRIAVSIGCSGERCSSDGVSIQAPFRCACPNCGNGWTAHRRTKRIACGLCCKKFNGGKWSASYVVKWSRV